MRSLETIKTFHLLFQMQKNLQKSPQEIRCLQNNRLRNLIHYAYENVPFYRKHWNSFRPDSFSGLADLHQIAIMNKAEAKTAAQEKRLFPRYLDFSKCTYLDSSGSSGKAFRIWKRSAEERVRRCVGLRIWFDHGYSWFDQTAHFQILPGPSFFLQKIGISRKRWISTALSLEQQREEFFATQADVIIGTPTGVRKIAGAIEASGKKCKPPKIVFCAGEAVDYATQDIIRKVFQIQPVGIYGQTEVGFVAWQCQKGNFHINADTHIVEIIRENGELAQPGEIGKIVITDLFSRTMPFIRYNTEDLASFAPHPCKCGLAFPVIEAFHGRKNQGFYSQGRFVNSSEIVNHMAQILPPDAYRLQQVQKLSYYAEILPSVDINKFTKHLLNLVEKNSHVEIKIVNGWPDDGTGKTHCILPSHVE